MRIKTKLIIIFIFLLVSGTYYLHEFNYPEIVYTEIDPNLVDIKFFSKDENGNHFRNIGSLKNHLNNTLIFAMNGGIFKEDLNPLGLYIESGKMETAINLKSGYGNFYMNPNGVFYLTKNKKANIVPSSTFTYDETIEYATQSGPMLIINKKIHKGFHQDSKNYHIRNGVCILDSGKLIFAISKNKINLYQFAKFFEDRECLNALYLDGFVSKAFIPEKNLEELEGDFSIIIAAIKEK
ncbi:MAG TPA: phosphodiester glycosidase family protein [Leptospiraceae bacterium]|nr:phosphodiester glycosidase family protein [Leptospiraceae bacterium]HMW03769.1 phosphodiester glycosidase family protein [Leptospiraceae bacterium]HMX34251.1 phosphodiester glycosidase family protein [Leptospiraceae bacterium]HMY29749.1 phosphodiester glycosidase family protein [Leptospiraceae bacterium]HMZ62852.1 phosphodiester glycosidase family protein [Leptospiraceae bacterium]